ncbi:hypothetical protein RRG08_020481, partial [Elysia crispata]
IPPRACFNRLQGGAVKSPSYKQETGTDNEDPVLYLRRDD